MFLNVASLVLFTMAEMKMVIANILEGSQLEHQCSGTLLIVDVETAAVVHKIKNTNMDIIMSPGEEKKVDITQTGNCCHHVFSDRKCRGEVTTILDNVKHRMKHRGHMSVIKSDMAKGICRSIIDIKNTGICKINNRYDKKQIPEYHDPDESLTNKLETKNNKITKDTASNNNKNDTAAPNPKENENNTYSSLTAICAPLIIVIILVNIFGMLYKRNNFQTSIHSNINLKNDWSPINNDDDDFATDMNDSDSQNVIRNEKVINKRNADYELATSNHL